MLKSVLLSLALTMPAMATSYTAVIHCGESSAHFVDRCFSESDFVLKRDGQTERYSTENSLLTIGYPFGTGIGIELPEHFTITATNTNNETLSIAIIRNDNNSIILNKEAARNKTIHINQ
ncbi:hypothetical protein [Pseudescherichia sp.]|uniref:hypothetical protein n=1 Tax=Pseudescherichia sp. TaxID=2055881 RepID=UPI00289E075F|nr:hypothetical protein [Pseudescherichia sp.]